MMAPLLPSAVRYVTGAAQRRPQRVVRDARCAEGSARSARGMSAVECFAHALFMLCPLREPKLLYGERR